MSDQSNSNGTQDDHRKHSPAGNPTATTYDPNRLLDSLIDRLQLKNDAALSRTLEVAPPVISKIRHKRVPVRASLLIRMHEVTNLSIRELRDLMGDRRQKYRISDSFIHVRPL
ncbi:hypothetical protein [Noviherbaspirillum sp. Root189]|uniref:hypothetical protein n=1 Tax=Noviherbaspirillum sp. Root189 TaxID=1736487 RepID=UPI000B327540|nr:hypothetical protein [Noviherbaspirillum sp. Root189]